MEVTTKICTKCQISKTLEEFNKLKSCSDSLRSWCKSCQVEYSRQWKKNNPEKVSKHYKQWQINNPEKYAEKQEYTKQWHKDNPEKCKEIRIKCYKNNIEKRREYKRQYRIDNPEYNKQWYANNPEKAKEHYRQYRIDNSEKYCNYSSIRRALIRNSIVENVDLLQLYKDHKYICGICGKKIDRKLKWPNLNSISHDHIIPISKGGSHIYDNIQPAHLGCNIRKFTKIDNIQLVLQTA